MKSLRPSGKAVAQAVLVAACVIAIAVLVWVEAASDYSGDELSNVRFASEDGRIVVTWELPRFSRVEGVLVRVHHDGGGYTRLVPAGEGSFTITDGTHGEAQSHRLLFLDFDKLPDLPTVYLETATGEDPPWEVVNASGIDEWGDTLTDNDYVEGTMTLMEPGSDDFTCETEIRMRGNTSSAQHDKKSYKLRLGQSYDMLGLGWEYASREWVLLNVGTSLNNYVGQYVSEACGMEWVAHGRFVNVMVNGDWKGLFYLIEPVSKERAGNLVSSTGYIFENDAYWWKEDTPYFRLEDQIHQMAFTFRYPEVRDSDSPRARELQDYAEDVFGLIVAGDSSVSSYIDFDSFASWVMVRDAMQTIDAAGSNMYYYLYDLDTRDYTANKLKMGPVWDFDGGMRVAEDWFGDSREGWSAQHTYDITYFPYLFNNSEFRRVYRERWELASQEIREGFSAHLDELWLSQGEAIEESRRLDGARWDEERQTLEDEIAYDTEFMDARVAWIDSAVGDW